MNQVLSSVQRSILQEILQEIRRRSLEYNKYRTLAGEGKSQAFGIVSKRSMLPDLSRNNWNRPYLAFLLEKYGKTLENFEYTSITVNENYKSKPHRDKGNCGDTYIIAFGDFTGGELCVEKLENQDIQSSGFVFNGATELHSTMPWLGDRYSLVFYKAKKSPDIQYTARPLPIVLKGKQSYEMKGFGIFKDDEQILRLSHPLAGRKKLIK